MFEKKIKKSLFEPLRYQVNFRENIMKYTIDLPATYGSSLGESLRLGLPFKIKKVQEEEIKEILTETKLSHESYHDFLFLLLKNSRFMTTVDNIKKGSTPLVRIELSFNYRKVLKNFRYLLNTLYNEMHDKPEKNQELINFELKRYDPSFPYHHIASYPEIREFFDSMIPKLNEYNKRFLYYSRKHSKLSVKINYEEVMKDLCIYFRQHKYVKKSRKMEDVKLQLSKQHKELSVIMAGITILCILAFLNFPLYFIIVSSAIFLAISVLYIIYDTYHESEER